MDAKERMKSRLKKLEDKAEGKGGEGNNFFTLEQGKNIVRVLPPIDPEQPFYFEALQHFGMGPQGRVLRCIGKGCPACARFEKLKAKSNEFPRGSEAGKKAYRKATDFRAKTRFFMNVINPKDPERKVQVLSCGETILKPMLVYFFDDEEYGDFTRIKTGYSIYIERSGQKRDTEYSVRASTKKVKLEDYAELKGNRHDLNEAANEILTPKAFAAIMDGVEVDEEESEEEETDDDEVEAEDDEDEAPKKKVKSKAKPAVEEDDDDEDERPVAKKLKAKAR